MLNFNVQDSNGSYNMSSAEMANLLSENTGLNVMGLSPDGTQMMAEMNGQQATIPISEFAQSMGLKVNEAIPTNINEDAVDWTDRSGYRHAIENLNDPDEIKTYLTFKAKKMGIDNPQILGKGTDWYLYDPKAASWLAMTNNKGFDASDVVGGANDIVKAGAPIAGGIVGGSMGLGAGSIATGALGAGLGSAAAEAGTRGIAAFDPDYRQSLDVGQAVKNAGITAGVSAVGGALPGALSVGARAAQGVPILGKTLGAAANVMGAGPVSTAARGVGGVARATGEVAERVGQAAGTMPGKIGMELLDPTGISLAGRGVEGVLTAPAMLRSDSLASPIGAIGRRLSSEEGLLGMKAPNLGKKFLNAEESMINASKRNIQNQGSVDAFKLNTSTVRQAESNLKNKGIPLTKANRDAEIETLAKEFSNKPTTSGFIGNMRQDALMRDAEQRAAAMSPELRKEFLRKGAQRAKMSGDAWQKNTKLFDTAEYLGQKVGSGVSAAEEGVAKGLQYGGKGLKKGGTALQKLGTVGGPTEQYGWGQFATGKLSPYDNEWNRDRR